MEPNSPDPRVSAAESDVRGLRDDLRDFGRATVGSFNAMREDMVSMGQYVYAVREDMDHGFIEMRGKFDAAAAGQQQIVELLARLIADQG